MPTLMRLFFVAIGLAVFGAALWSRSMNHKAASWPCTDGEILSSSLRPAMGDSDPRALIRYSYLVAGKRYSSDRLTFAGTTATTSACAAQVASYPVGQTVDVYYNPQDPAQAVLQRNPSMAWAAGVAVGAFFALLGVLLP